MNVVLVCGGRDFEDYLTVRNTLNDVTSKMGKIDILISGGANGADSLAEDWAKAHGVKNQRFPANWKKYGNYAGPLRNDFMAKILAEYAQDPENKCLCVAFPGGRGTADMVAKVNQLGIVEILTIKKQFEENS